MRATMLSFNSVNFGYKRTHPVLRQVSFELCPGRIMAVLGPNGVGKTTLLNLALGWLSPWGGDIYLENRPLHNHTRLERGRKMALVPQSEHTPFDYTTLEYVVMGRAPHLPPLGMPTPADYEIAMQSLEQVGLAALASHPVPQLSGGESQLMLLARAIAQSPSLLLLDEPTAHLDLHNKARIIEIMRNLRAQGVSILMTNHEPEVVLALADDVLLLDPSEAAQFGSTEEVFTAEALSRIYNMPIRLAEVDGRRQVLWT